MKRRANGTRRWGRLSRDTLLFLIGLLGIVHETLLTSGPERPTLLLIFAAFMGLPLALGVDRKGDK